MALLRNLEQSLSGLVEGTIGRVFRTEVRPTEIARKLAREMEINKRVSLSRTYAPTDYLVYLSQEDRGRYAGVESSIAEELGAYLLEHARRERLVLVRRPLVEFRTDQRLRLGEFGIEARTAPISAEEAPPRAAPQPAPARMREEPQPQRPAPQANIYDAGAPDMAPVPLPAPQGEIDQPIGAPAPDAGPSFIDSVDDAPYEDPYANDFDHAGPDSAEFEWQEPDSGHEPYAEEQGPEPARVEPHPGPAAPSAGTSGEPDWLDPVDDWAVEPASEAQPPSPEDAQPSRQVQPHAPGQPAAPSPIAGAPWIDPTLRRQHRPQTFAPAVPQQVQQPAPQPAAPRVPDSVLLIDGTPHELKGDRVIVGRSRSADIVVSDPSISRQHVELRRDDRGWYAVDLGATNGTEIAGERLTEPRRLETGQRIKLGHADAIIEVR